MPRLARFLLLLLCGLALLTGVGYAALTRTTHRWFESDLRGRARLVVTATTQSLATHWEPGEAGLTGTLEDITRDERIMGAAACSFDGRRLAVTAAYPANLGCQWVRERMRMSGLD